MKMMLALLLFAGPSVAQQATEIPLKSNNLAALVDFGGVIETSFRMQRAGMRPPDYTVTLKNDGSGSYQEGSATGAVQALSKKITVSGATWKRIVAGAGVVQAGNCETKMKNIAQTGQKHISYSWKNTDVVLPQCDFNYSDDETLNDAAASFQAIAETIQAGERLKYKKRFDHLGLDAELDSLISQVKAGYAIELQNIALMLQAIADDDDMLASSRRKATSLLTMAVVPGTEKK